MYIPRILFPEGRDLYSSYSMPVVTFLFGSTRESMRRESRVRAEEGRSLRTFFLGITGRVISRDVYV